MITNVYIDGFNLYYRALQGTPYKWLNLRKLAEALFPQDTIRKVCYFTALIIPRPNDVTQPQRQQAYLRALATLPGLEIHYGTFRARTKYRALVTPVSGLPTYVEVKDSEEKGSDVNLATRLLVDGFNGDYEQAVVVSNDADFAEAMRYVRDGLGLKVSLVNPNLVGESPRQLSGAATYIKRVRRSHLRRSQFPATLRDNIGTITKPPGW